MTTEAQPGASEPDGAVETRLLYLLILVFVGGGAWTWWQLVQAFLG